MPETGQNEGAASMRVPIPGGGTTGIPDGGTRDVLHRNPVQTIIRVAGTFNGVPREYFVNDTRERAGMVAVRAGAVLLVRQYRLLIDGLSWEIPGGRVDAGETAESAAVRECFEETGVRCREAKLLAFFQPGLDASHNPTSIFWSEETEDGAIPEGVHTHLETTGHAWIPLPEALRMIEDHRILDALTMVALLSLQARVNPSRG